MSCDIYEVGSRVEAITDFQIRESLAAPVEPNIHQIHSGAIGEVKQKRVVGNTHWLIIRWDHVNRDLNLDGAQFDFVKAAS